MSQANNNQADDFFTLLDNQERISNPFDNDEVLIKDEQGNIKVVQATIKTPASAVPPIVSQAAPTASPPPAAFGKRLDIQGEIQAVIKKSGVHFNDAEMEKRFKVIVESALRGVRSRVETRETLTGPIADGNMGFDATHGDTVMALIDEQSQLAHDKFRAHYNAPAFSGLQAEAEALLQNVKAPVAESALTELSEPVAVFKPTPVPVQQPKPLPTVQPPEPEPNKPVSPPAPASLPRITLKSDSARPKVEDIKFKPKLTGPLEEIGNMSVTDFRRLAPSPDTAIQKILDKVSLLEEESFSQKTAAVAAWKDSPVNKLYLELFSASLEAKLPISQVIAARQQANQTYLTEEEIHAIIELNSKLRY